MTQNGQIQQERTRAADHDAIVVGAGINGMVAAAELAGAGWRVCLIDEHERIGGFIASAELTEPGFIHDTFSSWHPLFHTGGAYAELGADLARHGLSYRNTDGPLTASVGPDSVVVAHRDPEQTAAGFAAEADRSAYLKALERLGADLDVIGELLGTELRSPAAAGPLWRLLRRGGLARVEGWARDTAMSGRAWCARMFTGGEVDQLWVPWLLHGGLNPDAASGGLMVPLFAATMHGAGLPVVTGGAGEFVAAFERLLAERGVTVLTGNRVERLIVEDGRTVGVVADDGQRLRAERAVLCSVTPQALWQELLPDAPPRQRAEAQAYRYGRGAMQVHLSLDRPLQWQAGELAGVPLVHLSSGSASTGIACAEASAGLLPRRPTVVVGQQFLLDETRVPTGRGQLWLQLQEVPYAPSGDAAGELDTTGGWAPELCAGFLDRVLRQLEEYAPGVRDSVREVHALAPPDLTWWNPNAQHGDPYSGSAELHQNLLWRPGPATGRHRTVVPGLWHIGASTHPGPGLGGGSGHLAAQQLLAGDAPRLQRLRRRLGR
ncbi:phytoene desaturase family protein [Enemella evansiae]|uniref:phytoene desaturase family protein n=1 Tax=Enemella evansiae TaxID=2016499 RepID=UPI0010608984|nr:NAD(P)/FAD-dependent oxidoreductase [Enemella evansiae]TDO91570.1 phytoene dehydrogenase-like protein [Enemella evansiae]